MYTHVTCVCIHLYSLHLCSTHFIYHTSLEMFLHKETLYSAPTKEEAAAPIDVHAEAQVAVFGFSWRVPTTGGDLEEEICFPKKIGVCFAMSRSEKIKEGPGLWFFEFFVGGGKKKLLQRFYVGFTRMTPGSQRPLKK